MLRSIAVSFMLFGLTAPSALAQTVDTVPASQATGKKAPRPKAETAAKPTGGSCGIGVISHVGNEFAVQKVGITLFGNEYASISAGSWGLDDLVVAKVRAAAPGVVVKKIAYAKNAFAAFDNPKPALFRDGRSEFATLVRQIAASAGCERYVVVTKGSSLYGATNQRISGVGIVNQTALVSRTYLFALTYIFVYDGRDFTVIKQGDAGLQTLGERVFSNSPVRGASRKLEDYSWPASPAAVDTPEIRSGARALLAESLGRLPEFLAR